jgi:hypothetical protein
VGASQTCGAGTATASAVATKPVWWDGVEVEVQAEYFEGWRSGRPGTEEAEDRVACFIAETYAHASASDSAGCCESVSAGAAGGWESYLEDQSAEYVEGVELFGGG